MAFCINYVKYNRCTQPRSVFAGFFLLLLCSSCLCQLQQLSNTSFDITGKSDAQRELDMPLCTLYLAERSRVAETQLVLFLTFCNGRYMLLVSFLRTAKVFWIIEKVSMYLRSFSWLPVFFLTRKKRFSIFIVRVAHTRLKALLQRLFAQST